MDMPYPRPGDFRVLFDATENATEQALAQPAGYMRYRQGLQDGLKRELGFFAKCDVQPVPLAVPAAQRAELARLAAEMREIVETVVQMYVGGLPELAAFFAGYEGYRPLMVRQLGRWQLFGRFDFMVDRNGVPLFIENNAAMPGGFLSMHRLQRRFLDSAPPMLQVPGMAMEAPEPERVFVDGMRAMVRGFTAADGAIGVLLDENRKTNELDVILPALARTGLPVVVGPVGALRRGSDGRYRLSAGGPPLVASYNKMRLFGARHSWSAEGQAQGRTFKQAMRENAFLSINNFACVTVAEDKGLFAALRLPAVQAALTPRQRAFVDRHTPQSHLLDAAACLADGRSLAEAVKAERGEWVLKPRNDYQGSGVVSGRDHDAATWSALVDGLLAGDLPYMAQRRIDPFLFPVAACADGRVARTEVRLLGGIYYLNGEIGNIVARVSPSEVANVSAGKAFVLPQVAVPTAWR